MPALSPYIIDPIREQFVALSPERGVDHPLGCHNPRIPEGVVFDKLVRAPVFGCAYERIADETCSATTLLRRRRDEWIASGVMGRLQQMVLDAHDRTIGLDPSDVAVDRCTTKAPCGGRKAGRSPVDRGKGGVKRSMVADGGGVPLGAIAAPANRHDPPLSDETPDTTEVVGELPERMSVHLDRGYDSRTTRGRLRDRGFLAGISRRRRAGPAGRHETLGGGAHELLAQRPQEAGVVHGEARAGHRLLGGLLGRVIIIVRRLVREGWSRHRWEGRPCRRP